MLRTGLAVLSTLTLLCAAHAELATTNAKGQITSLLVAGEYIDVQTNIRVPIKGWGKQPSP